MKMVRIFTRGNKLRDIEPEKDFIIVGHRGASKYAPEDTIASFKKALELGANGIECDVLFTRDDIPVIAHHYDISTRALPRPKLAHINEMDIAEVKKLDVGLWFSKEYAGERIPTLREALFFLKGKVDRVYLHDKRENDYTVSKGNRISIFAEEIRSSNMKDKVVVMVESGDLYLWQTHAPDIELLQCWAGFGRLDYARGRIKVEDSFLSGVRHMGSYTHGSQPTFLGGVLHKMGLRKLALIVSRLQIEDTVRGYRMKGCDFTVFTINNGLHMLLYLNAGFKAIGTDDPALLVSIIRDYKRHVQLKGAR
ncbi:glycerophosphodiester phosphodiesterase [Candidatus Omnitrophota bacterium]